MKPSRALYLLLVLIGVFAIQDHPLNAQSPPDCSWTATFTGDGNTTAHSNFSSSNTPCVSWRITFSTTGTLSSAIAFQTSPDNSSYTSVPNTICSSSVQPPCVTEGANPTSNATVGNVAVRAYSAYTRVNISGSTGSGTGSIAVFGYKGTSVNVLAAGSGGGGGTVSSPGMTTNTIPKATGSQTIADSLLTDISSVLTYTGRINATANYGAGTGVYGAAATVAGALDVGISRTGAATMAVGNGTAGDFSGTFQANTLRGFNSIIARGSPTANFGTVTMVTGADATHTGYAEWRIGDGTRRGYIGNDTTDLTVNLENSAKFIVSGGNANLQWTGSTSGSASIQAAAVQGTPQPLQLPTSTGSNGQILSTNGASPQQLSWVTNTGGITGLTTGAVVAGASATSIATPSATTTLDSSGNLSAAGTITAAVKVVTPIIAPASNSTTAIKVTKADGSTNVLDFDTTNTRIGLGTTAPIVAAHVSSNTAPITGGFGTLTDSVLRVQTENATAGGTAAEIQIGGRSTSGTLPFGAISGVLTTNSTGTGQIGDMVFSTHAAVGDAALTERMRIVSNGTIGVGTSTTSSTSSSLTLASNLAMGASVIGMASSATGAFDTGISRLSGGTIAIGNGTAADITGAYSAALGTHTINAIGSTPQDGLVLINTTAAAAGAQQYSPRLRLTGQGWKTNATAASQTVDWAIYNIPIQGTANPTSALYLTNQTNGGLYSTAGGLYLNGQGNLSTTIPKIGMNGSQNPGTGLGSGANNQFNVIINSTDSVGFAASKVALNSSMELGWTNGAPGTTPTIDTGFARNAAGTIEINAGTIGTIAGGVYSREYGSGGTVPGISGCTAGTQTGGGSVGTFASGTTGVCTVTLTFAKTAPNGWFCVADNQTTFASFANIFTQTGGSTTTCIISATTVSGDVIKFAAFYY